MTSLGGSADPVQLWQHTDTRGMALPSILCERRPLGLLLQGVVSIHAPSAALPWYLALLSTGSAPRQVEVAHCPISLLTPHSSRILPCPCV